MRKRILSLLLAAAMVVTLLPVTAWAEEVPPVQDSGSTPAIGESIATGSNASEPAVTENTLLVSVDNVTDSGATLTFTGNADGTVSYLVQKSDETAPDEADVLAGETVAVTTGSAITAELTGLTAETDYTAYALLEADDGSRSAIASARFATGAAAPVLMKARALEAGVSYMDENGVEREKPADEVTEITDTDTFTSLSTGWYVVNGDIRNGQITVAGDVALILADGCTLTVPYGIIAADTNRLSIYGQADGTGRLTANGSFNAAGIGGDWGRAGGTVNVYGGTVNATGNSGAGIGGGMGGDGGTVNVYGGTVNATGSNGAGIGGGSDGIGAPTSGDGGTVNIYGGTVNATGSNGAGIGSGGDGNGGTVNIYGGTVNATGSNGCAGIGSGVGGNGGTVSISGGTVMAAAISNSSGAADIGGGGYASFIGSCVITGGSVRAAFTSPSSPTPIDGAANPVSLTTVTLFGVSLPTAIQSLNVTGASYGVNGMETVAGDKLYLWLPVGAAVTAATAGGRNYAGSIPAGTSGVLMLSDTTLPTVASVTPSGPDTPISGNLVITFREAMNISAGAVSLDGGATSLTGGGWTIGNTVYTAPYALLDYSTEYTLSISGFEDTAGNRMTADASHRFTTVAEPLTPSVSTNTLSVKQGGTAGFTVSFGQGASAATAADITVANGSIASVGTDRITASGTVTINGLAAGTTGVTVAFNDTANTQKTIAVTVQPIAPVWPAGSTLTAPGITSTAVVLTWTAAQDSMAVTGYKLYQNGLEIASVVGNVYSRTVTGLAPSTSYSFAVQAVNAGGLWTTDGPNATVTTSAASTGDNPNGGNSSSSGSNLAVFEKQPDYPVTAEISIHTTTDRNGHDTATVPGGAIADAIKRATATAKSQGRTENGIGISVKVNVHANTKSLGLVLSQSVLKQLADAKVLRFEVNGQLLTLSLDQEAIRQLLSQSTGDITVTVKPVTVAGVRNAYEITFTTVKDGKTVTITSLGSGSATLSIPCTPAKNEATGYLYAVYVDAKGKHNRISGSVYDPNSGSILLGTNHFSAYGVGYEAPSAKFTDISTHWGKDSIDYVVGRGLLSGTSKTTFAPDTAMTRGMLVTALGRLAGVDVKAYTTNSFTDVKADSAFRPYIEWAYKKGVVQGIGNQQFAPDRAITREEIAVIFVNYAKVTGYKLPVTREATTYADASSIGSIYKTAVTAMQQAGIMMGENGNKFNPKAPATRAEVSAMLHRYIKLTIDPDTAQGWALNDAGQYLYYKDGKALTGTQTIDGVKYFFNTDGTLKTGWVKDGGNWRYYTGNKVAVDWLDISDKRYYFTKDGVMVSGKWLEIDGKWYYFNTDGSLAKNTKVDGYEVDKNGVRKTK